MLSLNPQYWEANQTLMYKFKSIVGIVLINQLLGNANLCWLSLAFMGGAGPFCCSAFCPQKKVLLGDDIIYRQRNRVDSEQLINIHPKAALFYDQSSAWPTVFSREKHQIVNIRFSELSSAILTTFRNTSSLCERRFLRNCGGLLTRPFLA